MSYMLYMPLAEGVLATTCPFRYLHVCLCTSSFVCGHDLLALSQGAVALHRRQHNLASYPTQQLLLLGCMASSTPGLQPWCRMLPAHVAHVHVGIATHGNGTGACARCHAASYLPT